MTWDERVKAADVEAEIRWAIVKKMWDDDTRADVAQANALIAIAAELRAQRTAQRPGVEK